MPKPTPDDFGGLLGYWLNGRAYLVRYGHGQPIEGVQLSPLNLLQARKIIDGLIENGKADGSLTAKDERQAEQLPALNGPADEVREQTMSREEVDRIAGPG